MLITNPALAVAVGLLGGVLIAQLLKWSMPLITRWAYSPRGKR